METRRSPALATLRTLDRPRGACEIATHIWLSSAGAATTQVIRMLRENPSNAEVRIFGTNIDASAPALTACDVAEVEPRYVSAEEYAGFALDFCRRHRIDVLLPPRRLEALAPRAADFAALGTRLLCPPAAAVRVLTHKGRTYEEAARIGVPVPPWRVVRDAEAFRTAVAELAGAGRLCVKPAGEYSAFGFRILDDEHRPLGLRELLAPPEPVAAVDAVAGALKRAADAGERIPELIVMPYLDDPEISVDCLAAPGGRLLTAIARAKEGRYRLLLDDPALEELARTLVGHFGLPYLSNIQLRQWRGAPVLLEANPRASAGVFQTAFTGVNLPWAAVRLALTGDAYGPGPLPRPRLGGRVAVTEAVTEVGAASVPERAADLEGDAVDAGRVAARAAL
ncbi:ATP-grasp domain-containing protein [Streptomyces sp. NPDC051940]|uniref:ATP-grasp domain-containing protein n=1 Tax=Streptomyces sp. NPDC051940 TaxID=3155675 RepID=UPI0034433929